MTRSLSDASLPWPCCSFRAETDTVIAPMSTHLRTISPEGHSFLRKRWRTWRLDLSSPTPHATERGQKREPCGRAHQTQGDEDHRSRRSQSSCRRFIEMIALHRGERQTPAQGGLTLRRYRRGCRGERLFSPDPSFLSAGDPQGV